MPESRPRAGLEPLIERGDLCFLGTASSVGGEIGQHCATCHEGVW